MNTSDVFDNILIVGNAGTGKTRDHISPAIAEAKGNYVIYDRNGCLFREYADLLEEKGYEVRRFDPGNPFDHPTMGTDFDIFYHIVKRGFYAYDDRMIELMAGSLAGSAFGEAVWNDAYDAAGAKLLVSSFIYYLLEQYDSGWLCHNRSIGSVLELIDMMSEQGEISPVDLLMNALEYQDNRSIAVKKYRKFRALPVERQLTVVTMLGERLSHLKRVCGLRHGNSLYMSSYADKKMAAFISISDRDFGTKVLADTMLSVLMFELCTLVDVDYEIREEDECRLEIPVRFILDDLGTECLVPYLPTMLPMLKARNISVMATVHAWDDIERYYGNETRRMIERFDKVILTERHDKKTEVILSEMGMIRT